MAIVCKLKVKAVQKRNRISFQYLMKSPTNVFIGLKKIQQKAVRMSTNFKNLISLNTASLEGPHFLKIRP